MATEPGTFCPICKFKNEPTATVCAYCGNPLSGGPVEVEDTTTRHVSGDTAVLPEGESASVTGAHIPTEGIAIYALGHTRPVAVIAEQQFVLGRKTDEDTGELVINLSAYGAFDHGVSRRHARVVQTADGYEIIDLDSTNGTWLNEKRLAPQVAYPLGSGAQLRLGRMHLVAIYRGRGERRGPAQ